MKNKIYLFAYIVFSLIGVATKAQAQYHITSHSLNVYSDSFCRQPDLDIETNVYAASLNVTTFFGDGTFSNAAIANSGSYGYLIVSHNYTSAGTYTVKQVLYDGSIPIDSVIGSYEYLFCNTFVVKAFNDLNNNCVFDSTTESYATIPITVEVDSSNIPIDTLVTSSGFYYRVSGYPGTIYAFKVIPTSPGISVSCPVGGVIYDTVQPVVNNYSVKTFAVTCNSVSNFDIGEHINEIAGRHHSEINIIVNNAYCDAQNATLTMHFSPKYNFTSAYPAPASVTGNTVTWSFVAVSAITPVAISVSLDVPGSWLIPGDTVHSDFTLTPTAGDLDPTNNYIAIVDTVTGSYDPNEKSVSPEGYIHTGTKLTYTINFENTGNDTAFNIYVLDTLSANVDPKSLEVVSAAAAMNVSVFNDGIYNIAKFDFPHINLLDSTHPNQNSSMFMYSINAKTGLPGGTVINNKAGIYFDYNSVVMTNNVVNTIGIPTNTAVIANVAKVDVYPNPVSDELNVQLDNGSYDRLTITNTIGQVMMVQDVNGAHTTVNVKALPTGVYYITLKGDSGVKVQQFEKM